MRTQRGTDGLVQSSHAGANEPKFDLRLRRERTQFEMKKTVPKGTSARSVRGSAVDLRTCSIESQLVLEVV